jgi:Dolichyl-phosphate-mannose-protein mannosyltransferase
VGVTTDLVGQPTGSRKAIADGPVVGLIGAAAVVVIVVVYVVASKRANGVFAYPLDDTYIHLRLAENLSKGVLGINPGQFASASSSPLWSLVLAPAILLFGHGVAIPLVLTTTITVVTVYGTDRWLRGRGHSVAERSVLVAGLLIVVPLPVVALLGMEHALQIALVLLVLNLGIGAAMERRDRWHVGLGVLIALAMATRYETGFVVVALVVLFATRRLWRLALTALAGTALTLIAVGAVNLGQGWPFLPASIVAKTQTDRHGLLKLLPNFRSDQVQHSPRLIVVVALCVVLCWYASRRGGPGWEVASNWSYVFFGVVLLHLGYAQVGGLFRYEAYLVAVGLVVSALLVHSILGAGALRPALPRWAWALTALLLLVAVVDGGRVYRVAWVGMNETAHQQIEMARFLRTTCPGCHVAVNDIGAVSMYGDVKVTDVFGLADRDVLRAKSDDRWNTAALERATKAEGVDLALVYDARFWIPKPPSSWSRVGTWTYPHAVVSGGNVVSFFAVDPSEDGELRKRFAEFTPRGARVHVDPPQGA